MATMPHATKEMLLTVYGKLPYADRQRFVEAVRREFKGMTFTDTLKYTALGAACGAALELMQFDRLTGIEDWAEIGAACGAAVGLTLDWRARREKCTVQEKIRAAVATAQQTDGGQTDERA